VPFLPQLFEFRLHLVCNSLATNFSAIIREATGVALRDKYVEVRISLTDAVGEVLEVAWVTPKTGRLSARAPPSA
jgi:hypothetical protein